MLLEASRDLASSPAPVVIDHYGLYSGFTPNDAGGRSLLALLGLPHVWVKLSAPYRSMDNAVAAKPDPAWLAAILAAAADRCVWGSDWPHTPPHELQTGNAVAVPYRDLRYEDVVDGFLAALPSAARRRANELISAWNIPASSCLGCRERDRDAVMGVALFLWRTIRTQRYRRQETAKPQQDRE